MLLKQKSDFFQIATIEEIAHTLPNQILRFRFDTKLLRYCQHNRLEALVEIATITEAILANHYQIPYLLAPKPLAPKIQKLADTYLFDTKVFVEVRFLWEIERWAEVGVDGAIVPRLP